MHAEPQITGTWDAGDMGRGELSIELAGRSRALAPGQIFAVRAQDPGAVNPRIAEIEDPVAIARRVRELSDFVAPEAIFLNPDWGFGNFADKPAADAATAFAKLAALAAAAKISRRNRFAIICNRSACRAARTPAASGG